jgi:polyisoprenoid-binding protein YceI
MLRMTRVWAAALTATTVALTALAADSTVDAAKSSIIATFKQEGVPVDAPFKTFSGVIAYDPANVAKSTASIDVTTGSLDIGDDAYNAEVRKKAWFDSASFPTATFHSTSIKAGAAGHFDATGTLTVKGKALTVTVPIAVQSVAGGTAFDGSLMISRKAFGIGDPIWDDVLEDGVKVKFHLVSVKR